MKPTTKAALPPIVATAVTAAAGQLWLLPSTDQTWAEVFDAGDLTGMFIVWFAALGTTHMLLTGLKWKIEKVLVGLILLGVVTGVGSEVAECVAGRHFGDPGDGSNPFDRFCPNTKTNGPATPMTETVKAVVTESTR